MVLCLHKIELKDGKDASCCDRSAYETHYETEKFDVAILSKEALLPHVVSIIEQDDRNCIVEQCYFAEAFKLVACAEDDDRDANSECQVQGSCMTESEVLMLLPCFMEHKNRHKNDCQD